MIFASNLGVLKGKFSAFSRYMEQYRSENRCEIVQTRSGGQTIVYHRDSHPLFIHSKYNPEEEAELFVQQFDNVDSYSQVFFYGIGLGYHVEAFLRKFPEVNFSLYEPQVEIMYHFLSNKSLSEFPMSNLKNMYIETKPEDCDGNLNHYVNQINGEILFVVLPSYERVFKEDYERFKVLFSKQLQMKKNNLNTNLAYAKRWVANSMLNIPRTIQSPSILRDYRRFFADRPVLLVAAGPSLEEEIEHIKKIKENKSAYIFSVGSAVNSLMHHGIIPDAACTYDPQSQNQLVFKTIIENRTETIPLVFGTSVGYETVEKYPGPLLHMVTNQDSVAKYFLKNLDGSPIEIVRDAPSIAVVTLQLLCSLGCNPIILVGQNFAYRNNEYYAKGIDYAALREQLDRKEMQNGKYTEDVYGNSVLTNADLVRMKEEMELYTRKYEQIEIINTTKFGAKIENTTFMELAQVSQEKLQQLVVQPEWFQADRQGYDLDYLNRQIEKMEKSYRDLKNHFDEMFRFFKQIESYVRNKNFGKLPGVFPKFDKLYKKIDTNDYFRTILLPMNRVQFELLTKNVESIRFERDLTAKAKKLMEHFGKFIYECKVDIERIDGIYQSMMTRLQKIVDVK